MNTFKVSSFLLADQKWVPAGHLFIDNGGDIEIKEVEFPPENRFDAKDDADNFFREYYIKKGYLEKK